jgi:endonuclease I/V8-like Glu-specific endopeptidase
MSIPKSVIDEAEHRYRERTTTREATEQKLRYQSPMRVDTRERVEQRLRRLSREKSAEVVGAAVIATQSGHGPMTSVDVLERIIGDSDLIAVIYLEQGLAAARAIGRVRIRDGSGQVVGYGTGFLVSPRLLMTNNHVLEDEATADCSQVEFNFQDDATGLPLPTTVFDLEPLTFFLTDPALDFTLVAVAETAHNRVGLQQFGWCRLIEEQGKILLGECITIIQHPNGEPKQIALRENRLVDLLENFLHYKTDTAPGSSGSPLFNDQWEIVGLHHSGVPARDGNGNILAMNGSIWTPECGEHRIKWMANEGIRISRIVHHIKAQHLTGERERLREALLDSDQTLVTATTRPIGETRSNGSVPAAPNQDVVPSIVAPSTPATDRTFTVPLHITVHLGQPTTPGLQPLGDQLSAGLTTDFQSAATVAVNDLQGALDAAAVEQARTYYDPMADGEARETYYGSIDADVLNPDSLYQALHQLMTDTHTERPSYAPSRHVYPFVDLHPDKKLRSIYSGKSFTAEELIRADFEAELQRTQFSRRLAELRAAESRQGAAVRAAELDLLEAQFPFNCEHVVPQSWFSKREPMRGDLHHLFACESRCNSFRSNTPYFDFPDFEEAVRHDCGKSADRKFEPSDGKGAVARATLYFLLRYPGEIDRTAKELTPDRIRILLQWHEAEPPGDYERHRNMAIFAKQGNRNPLIDFPEWAGRIAFERGFAN